MIPTTFKNNVVKAINKNAFSQDITPNDNDPLILHFRIMSENTTMYNEMAREKGQYNLPEPLIH
jgi:hypothetical protein